MHYRQAATTNKGHVTLHCQGTATEPRIPRRASLHGAVGCDKLLGSQVSGELMIDKIAELGEFIGQVVCLVVVHVALAKLVETSPR